MVSYLHMLRKRTSTVETTIPDSISMVHSINILDIRKKNELVTLLTHHIYITTSQDISPLLGMENVAHYSPVSLL